MKYYRLGYGLVAAALAVSACSTGETDTAASPTAAVSSATSASATADAHNDADVSFAQDMVPHHRQAIEMSDVLLAKQDVDPRITALAVDIKAAQGPEIEQMTGWLAAWGVPSTMPGMPGHDMSDMPGHDMSGMGGAGMGMMSDADMTALRDADGAEAGRLFLTQMIEHHRGAITMAQQEIDAGSFPAAVQLARAIVSTQQAEITSMQELLKG